MRKKERRIKIIEEFVSNEVFDFRIRAIVGETLAKPIKPVHLSTIMKWYRMFLEEMAPEKRVPN